MKRNHYHNTNGLTAAENALANSEAMSQEAKVLRIFRISGDLNGFTPWEISAFFPKAPITSIRRAMSNLTRDGKLEKSTVTIKGEYGKPNYIWRLAPQQSTEGRKLA